MRACKKDEPRGQDEGILALENSGRRAWEAQWVSPLASGNRCMRCGGCPTRTGRLKRTANPQLSAEWGWLSGFWGLTHVRADPFVVKRISKLNLGGQRQYCNGTTVCAHSLTWRTEQRAIQSAVASSHRSPPSRSSPLQLPSRGRFALLAGLPDFEGFSLWS